MDNNLKSQNNINNQPKDENPLKYVDEFKNICHNMFKNFLDQNLCTIVDDVYKKFSDKLKPETGDLSKKELKEDFQQMISSAINETIESKTDEMIGSQKNPNKNNEQRSSKGILFFIQIKIFF